MLDDEEEIILVTGSALLVYRSPFGPSDAFRKPGEQNNRRIKEQLEQGLNVCRKIGYEGKLTSSELLQLAPMLEDLNRLQSLSLSRHNVEFEIRVQRLEFHSIGLGTFNLVVRKNKLISLIVAINLGLETVPRTETALQSLPGIVEAIPGAIDAISKAQDLGKKLLNDTILKEDKRHRIPQKSYQDRDTLEIYEELRDGRDLQAVLVTSI